MWCAIRPQHRATDRSSCRRRCVGPTPRSPAPRRAAIRRRPPTRRGSRKGQGVDDGVLTPPPLFAGHLDHKRANCERSGRNPARLGTEMLLWRPGLPGTQLRQPASDEPRLAASAPSIIAAAILDDAAVFLRGSRRAAHPSIPPLLPPSQSLVQAQYLSLQRTELKSTTIPPVVCNPQRFSLQSVPHLSQMTVVLHRSSSLPPLVRLPSIE